MPRSLPKRRVHNRWLRTTTGVAPGRSSSTVNVRPSSGATAKTSNQVDVAREPIKRSGCASSVRLKLDEYSAANVANARVCVRQP